MGALMYKYLLHDSLLVYKGINFNVLLVSLRLEIVFTLKFLCIMYFWLLKIVECVLPVMFIFHSKFLWDVNGNYSKMDWIWLDGGPTLLGF